MTPAATPHAPAAAWLLLPAGAICGFGLGMLALALWPGAPDPEAVIAARPAVRAVASAPVRAPAPSRPWPALFGTPAGPLPDSVLVPEDDEEPWPDEETEPEDVLLPEPPALPALRLRGLALDDEGGWALIETPAGTRRFRPGDRLSDDFRIGAVLADGVVIEGPDGETLLGFAPLSPVAADPLPVPDGLGRSGPGLARPGGFDDAAPDRIDRPPGVPPPGGFRMGPGFSGPPDR